MPFFNIFASPRWSPLRMRTKVVSFFICFKSFQTKKIKALWPKMTKIASRGSSLNMEVYTGSPKINLSCFREFEELERCLRYSDLKKFMVCACLILAGRLFQTSGALLVNESMPGREEGQNGRREFPLPLVWWECLVKLSLEHTEREQLIFEHISSHDNSKLECPTMFDWH